jgi:steroid 5-alpha reductase family enzyme
MAGESYNFQEAGGLEMSMSKSEGMVRIVVAYVVALFAGGCTLAIVDHGPLLNALIADIVATVVIYLFSRAHRNCSFIDAYWTVIPPFIALYWLAVGASEASTLRELLLFALVLYWATRLTLNWAYHWEGIHHEDWRYTDLRGKAPALGSLIDFFGIHLFPTLQVFLGLLPVYAVYCLGYRPINWLDIVAALITGGAITLQMLADFQLHRFIRTRREGEHLATGLWAWSRHPNYLGELGFWLGLFLFGIASMPSGWYWQIAGIAGMLIVFLVFSIPVMEKRSLERRPGYQEVIDSVPMLLPFPRKTPGPAGGR